MIYDEKICMAADVDVNKFYLAVFEGFFLYLFAQFNWTKSYVTLSFEIRFSFVDKGNFFSFPKFTLSTKALPF